MVLYALNVLVNSPYLNQHYYYHTALDASIAPPRDLLECWVKINPSHDVPHAIRRPKEKELVVTKFIRYSII